MPQSQHTSQNKRNSGYKIIPRATVESRRVKSTWRRSHDPALCFARCGAFFRYRDDSWNAIRRGECLFAMSFCLSTPACFHPAEKEVIFIVFCGTTGSGWRPWCQKCLICLPAAASADMFQLYLTGCKSCKSRETYNPYSSERDSFEWSVIDRMGD